MQINDPNGTAVRVSADGQLTTDATTRSAFEHAAIHGQAYSFYSGVRDIDATDTMLFVKNTGSAELHIEKIIFTGSNVICAWDVGIGSATTTVSGTAATIVNMNQSYSTSLPDATAVYDETGLADASVITRIWTPVTNIVVWDRVGIILGKNHYIQINQITESTSGAITILAYTMDGLE